MKTIQVSSASRYSRGSGRGRGRKSFAQVTFLTGESSARRSNTAHPEYKPGYGYIRLNPDARAIPLNALYEQEFAKAENELTRADTLLEGLEKKLEIIDNERVADVDTIGVAVAKAMLVGMRDRLKLEITAAIATVDDAEAKLAIVQRELPLEVTFVGAGLTY